MAPYDMLPEVELDFRAAEAAEEACREMAAPDGPPMTITSAVPEHLFDYGAELLPAEETVVRAAEDLEDALRRFEQRCPEFGFCAVPLDALRPLSNLARPGATDVAG